MKTAGLLFMVSGMLVAQVPNPTRQQAAAPPGSSGAAIPLFKVTVVSRTTKAVNYHHRTGTTHIDFRGTELMPAARGEASVESQTGSTKIDTALHHMSPANQFGPEYMTYVLWGITPEGRPTNLGEVVLDGDHAKLHSTTDLQTFGLIVTAEPYFAVTQPSDVVVAENFVRSDTSGTIEQVDAKYELLPRGQYVLNRGQYQPVRTDPKGPLQLAEAENAVQVARLAGAEHYAADPFHKAEQDLRNAQNFLTHGRNRKEAETNARESAQMAEDARIITFRKVQEERLANEREEAARREAASREQAARAAEQARLDQQRRESAEAERRAAEQASLRAEREKMEAQQAAAQASREKSAADAAREAAVSQQEAAKAEADRLRQVAQQAEADRAELRERLRRQLNAVLETRQTARGLIVNINDVLFDFGKYSLKPGAREKLAKVAGILLAYPGLKVQLEGHTDSIGSDEYNLRLSDERAGAVRDYLLQQSVPAADLTATGLGEADPVASNDTAAGRQQNRRVDMVVSGDPIGLGEDPLGMHR